MLRAPVCFRSTAAVVVASLFLLGVVQRPGIARAQTAPADSAATPAPSVPLRADEEKHRGDEAMIALRYQDALTHYRIAYEATKNPALLYNMGRAHEGLADFPKALEELEEFDAKAAPDLKARVPTLQALIADVRSRVATLVLGLPVAGAEIRVGNKVIGTSKPGQTVFRVNAGPQQLEVTHPDYFPFDRPLTLAPGRIETVDVVLASRSAEALLRVTSPVSGAAVTIDGKRLGNVPAETPLSPGQHRIALERDGYDSAETSVVVSAGEQKEVDVPMAARTIVSRWWFWTGIGVAVVAGAVVTYVALTTEKSPGSGTIPPGTVKAEGWAIRF